MEIFMADMKAGEGWGINERAVEKGCPHTFISARKGLKHGSWETEHDQIAGSYVIKSIKTTKT